MRGNMSRDSSRTYIHLHKPHHADLFEDFTSLNPTNPITAQAQSPIGATTTQTTTTTHPNIPSAQVHPFAPSAAPIHNPTPLGNTPHLAPEDINIPPQHQPPNPEDEDDVVPDQHAAFGITRAMALREGQKSHNDSWRDFESLRERVRGEQLRGDAASSGTTSSQQQQQSQQYRGGTRLAG